MRPVINTVQEALKLIDQELPVELKRASRWTFARELLVVAATSGKKRDVVYAFRQLKQALGNDRLLEESAVRLKASASDRSVRTLLRGARIIEQASFPKVFAVSDLQSSSSGSRCTKS